MPGFAPIYACRLGKIDFSAGSRYFLHTTGNRGSRFVFSGFNPILMASSTINFPFR
jgi:hypothetical protein